jgi:hypothetical protein
VASSKLAELKSNQRRVATEIALLRLGTGETKVPNVKLDVTGDSFI